MSSAPTRISLQSNLSMTAPGHDGGMASSSSSSRSTPSTPGLTPFGGSESGFSSDESSVTTPESSGPSSSPNMSKADIQKTASNDGENGKTSADDSAYSIALPPLPEAPKVEPLAIDAGNPDAWVARDERMIRLTGKYPYNVEAPLADLWKAGFLTPQSLFYVRNHGATPLVTEEGAAEWKLQVHGLVDNPVSFTIADLKRLFPTVTLPVTLVCAGNRRKEQNMVLKGLGFNWGAAGVSTGLFTGVYLADILEYCKPIKPVGAFPYNQKVSGRARHVIFEGIDELPKGRYGTSQRIQWARDRSKGMLIAWGLNGEPLSPDHGYPLRLVVPGQIGGRMVKWLNRIEVSDEESQHYLHFWDNKVLPTQVRPDQARNEEHWWKDPKYIINDLNINSAVTVPDHDQVLDLSTHPENEPFRIQGYAYTGGGKRIHRVEVSLDEGETWEISEIDCPEDKYRIAPIHDHPFFGTLDLSETEMSFAWCFWELKVDVARLRDAPAIFVRATDEGLAQQPRDMYWNAMSMMNNWWFRVAIHKTGESLSFEHPTVAGNTNGGWMQRMNEEGVSVRTPQFSAVAASSEEGAPAPKPKAKEDIMAAMTDAAKMSTMITRAQLAEHANEERPWFVINGHVYDGTEFLEKHPGGGDSITLVAGEDASEDFMAIHSMDAKKQLADFHLGKLEEGGEAAPAGQDDNWASQAFLHPKQWKSAKLVKRTDISHDSRILRFALDREDQEVGLPIGQHVFVRLRATNKSGETETVQRAYTPFSGNELRGYIDLLIKVYFPSSSVPTGGRMTMLIEDMKPGIDSIEFKGPLGGFTYLPGGSCRWKGSVRKLRNIAMIAGGSGITPIYSTLKGIAEDSDSGETNVWVLDANRTENDILARAQLDGLVERAAGRIKIWHVLSADDVAPSWAMGRGRVSLDLLRERLPPPPSKPTEEGQLEDTLALLCGPPAMEETVKKGLAQIGWDTDRTVVCF